VSPTQALVDELRAAVVAALGSSFRPKAIEFVQDLPKTRTLKIMRRLVRSVLLQQPRGDLSGLVNPESLDGLQALARTQPAATHK
jgi:acetyl-CoA synthetase